MIIKVNRKKEDEGEGDSVQFGGPQTAILGIVSGVAIALGLPALVLVFGQPLGWIVQTIIVILALMTGGVIALVSAFFGMVMPRHVFGKGKPQVGVVMTADKDKKKR